MSHEFEPGDFIRERGLEESFYSDGCSRAESLYPKELALELQRGDIDIGIPQAQSETLPDSNQDGVLTTLPSSETVRLLL